MMVKFFARGTGKGKGVVEYLTRKDDPFSQEERTPAPEVIRGDPEITKDLIDCLDFKHKYTSGVISFAPEDAPTSEQLDALMDSFEKYALAGLEPDQYNILWVKHTHTSNERVELHFVVPKVELTTQKNLNIAPPGWSKYFDPWRDYWNYSQNWARPDDPERARALHPGYEALIEAQNKRLGRLPQDSLRQSVNNFVEQLYSDGLLKSREDIISNLKEVGLEIPRAGQNYITVLEPESGKRVRLKGSLYEQHWRFKQEARTEVTISSEESQRARVGKLRQLQGTIDRNYANRLEYNTERYQLSPRRSEAGIERDAVGNLNTNPSSQSHYGQVWDNSGIDSIELLGSYVRRQLGVDGLRIDSNSLSLGRTGKIEQRGFSPQADQRSATPRDRGIEVDQNRQRELSSDSTRLRESDLEVFPETLHQARGLANERTRADIEPSLERTVCSVQAGYGAARRAEQTASTSEQTTTTTSNQLEQSSQQVELSSRAVNQCLQQLNQNLSRGRRRRKRQLNEELERFKSDINLVEYALAVGYEYDRYRSTRSSAVLEHSNGDKVVITTDRDGHGIYFSVRDERDNGTIIDFIQNRQHLNLVEVRSELRPWLKGRLLSNVDTASISKPEAISSDRVQILEKLSKMQVATRHPYLKHRGISGNTLADSRFEGTVYLDSRGNAIFPHHDRDGVTGFEGRNHDFKGFSSGGNKSIWRSNLYTSDRRLVVVESPIDALSYHQLYQKPDTRYIATGGSVGERQLEFIKSVFERAASRGMEIEIATDKDEAGEKLYEQLLERVPNDAKVSRVTPNKHKDWNELLQAELEQQRRQEQQKQRDRGFSL